MMMSMVALKFAGKLYHKDVKEKFLTDGHFVLQRYTKEPAFIVWREAVLTLDNFISFDFDLEGASFFIYDLTYGYERRFELHTSEDNIATYEKLIAYLSERERMEQTLDTLRFSNLRTLEQVIQRTHQKIILDVRSGKEKTYRI